MDSMLRAIRTEKGLTQRQVAEMAGISLRSYSSFENESRKQNTVKYRYLLGMLTEYKQYTEEHGILPFNKIIKDCSEVLKEYDIDYCYLFGSYARGTPYEDSDVDLLVSGNVTGIKFFGLAEKLREKLQKKIDLLDYNQLNNNPKLLNNILREGIRIYGEERQLLHQKNKKRSDFHNSTHERCSS